MWRNLEELGLYNSFAYVPKPTYDAEEEHVPDTSLDDVRHSAALLHDTSPDAFCEKATPEEQALGRFTRRRMKNIDTWPEWGKGERSQLDKFVKLDIYGKPCRLPKGGILLGPHWQYHINRTGQRRTRDCCDGSARAAPLLHQLASTYSSCVEQPVQRLFVSLYALLDHKIYGVAAADAFAHSSGPDVPTYVSIDDKYA